MKIRTYTHPLRRVGAWLWQAREDHQWLPLAIVGALLLYINSP